MRRLPHVASAYPPTDDWLRSVRDVMVGELQGPSFNHALLLAFAVTSLLLLGLGLLLPAGKTNIAGNSASPASITGLDPKSVRLGLAR
jgi:hypothetical protein